MIQDKFYTKFWFILLSNIILATCYICFCPIYFESNDDSIMLLLASGLYTGIPEPYLVFISYIYGWAISTLYTYIAGVEWYTIAFITIHILSISIIAWQVIKSKCSIINKVVYLILFYIIELYIISDLQFTTTTAICALAGIILFLLEGKRYKYCGILMFLLASLIRFEASYLVLITTFPLIAYTYINNRKNFAFSKASFIILFAILGGVPFGVKLIDNHIYTHQSQEWGDYTQYNRLRGQINDNPNAEWLKDFPNGISEDDYLLLRSFFIDTKIITYDNLAEIHQSIGNVSFSHKVRNLKSVFASHYQLIFIAFLFSIILLVPTIIWASKKSIIDLLYTTSSCFILIGLFVYISLDATLKYRVFISIATSYLWLTTVSINKLQKNKIANVTSLAILIFLSYSFSTIYKKANLYREEEETIVLKQLDSSAKIGLPAEEFIIPYGASLRLEYLKALNVSEILNKHNLNFKASGWLTKIPYNNGYFESYEDLIDKNAIILSNRVNSNALLIRMQRSIKEHYNKSVHFVTLAEWDNYHIVQCRETK